jgi:hypothetical protein
MVVAVAVARAIMAEEVTEDAAEEAATIVSIRKQLNVSIMGEKVRTKKE